MLPARPVCSSNSPTENSQNIGGRTHAKAALAFVCLTSALCLAGTAVAQGGSSSHHGPQINPEVKHDTSIPLKDMTPAPRRLGQFIHELMPVPRPHRGKLSPVDPVLQSTAPSAFAPSAVNNFDGVGNGFSGPNGSFTVNAAPPDTNGSVGPSHYVQIVNTDLAVFNKSGTAVYGPVPINTLWSGFGGGCETNNDGDPIVVYDRIADRWIISQFSVSTTPYLQCVAISQTGDPTGTYYRYSFSYGNADFPDYPKMGVWPDAYYETFNFFIDAFSFGGGEVCAFDRSSMLSGRAATQQCFNVGTNYGGLLPSDLDGANLPPVGSPNYIVSLGVSNNDLAFWKFHVDWTTPANTTLTGPTTLTVAVYSEACNGRTCIPQSGTSQQLDSLADRLMYRLAYRNFGSHESLVTNHSIVAGSSVGVRWYEIRSPGSTPSVYQQGTYAPDSSYRWMGSIAMDQSGNMALGFSTSSSSLHPEIHYTGRLAGDALGQMTQGEGVIIAGSGSQTGSNLSRWGDYSAMAVDPSDDCTFWYTNQYIPSNGAFNWKSRIASFQLPGCGPQGDFSISSSPNSLSIQQGNSGSSTVSTAVTSGIAGTVNLSATVSPAGPTVSLSPTSVTAGNSSALNVTVGSSVAPGTYTVTVTGTEGSAAHNTTVTATITAAPSDFSISASRSSLGINQGSSGTSTISTAVTSGAASTVNLSASVSPAGPTVSLNPTSVIAGGSSTLTVNVSSSVATGTYTVTITGTEGSATHSTTVTVSVTAPPPADFTIGASPSTLSIQQGGNNHSTISTTVVGSAGAVNLSASVNPAGPTATLNPTSVAAGGSSTLTVSVSSAVAPGTYTITVTGTEGSATHSSTVTVTVTAPPPADFTIRASPSTLSIQQGASSQSSISTTVVGSAGTVNLAASVNPAGPTATPNPTSVAAGGSSTLTVSVGSSVATGTYTVTVTGTEGSAAHSTSVTVTVTTPQTNPIINGGFENGNFTGWTRSGTTSVVVPGHTGNYAAMLGSTSPTNGTSSVSQTFVVPSTATTLSFWYKNVCTDTVYYDWAIATLRDNTSGGTLTLLPRTCTNNGAWVQVNYNISSRRGHNVTLTLTNRDDNYPSDPTYTLYDDVAVQ